MSVGTCRLKTLPRQPFALPSFDRVTADVTDHEEVANVELLDRVHCHTRGVLSDAICASAICKHSCIFSAT
jgi:hypothetical protein